MTIEMIRSVVQKKLCIYLSMLLGVFLVCPTVASNTFTMAFNHDPAHNPQYAFYQKVYQEAFTTLGFEFKYELHPSKRATQMANHGKVDGEPQRVFGYANQNPNQIRVDEPIFENRTLAFSIDPTLEISGLESLIDSDLRVDYLRGSAWSKKNLAAVVDPGNLQIVDESDQGFQKLIKLRSDVFIVLEVIGLKTMQSHYDYTLAGVQVVGQVGSNLSYPYLHKSHAELVPKLEQVLRNMKQSGRYDEILFDTMPYLKTR
ncbi:substrate-binding periplasmic protein [Vibrio brasiliensis]|uniref:substrate-binding periplasmic protein n=1 Tax=Vibrio brasiliensis TaxID=170652 RepID=UPI001EFE5C8C|nr:transporter substrate-binding domain-containing protein [Vibrio brasiliensis]MCG9725145.1 transporter substrate-binding domain-containing protein [Vibrio brasiliensis]